jgi:hypothetical protein
VARLLNWLNGSRRLGADLGRTQPSSVRIARSAARHQGAAQPHHPSVTYHQSSSPLHHRQQLHRQQQRRLLLLHQGGGVGRVGGG